VAAGLALPLSAGAQATDDDPLRDPVALGAAFMPASPGRLDDPAPWVTSESTSFEPLATGGRGLWLGVRGGAAGTSGERHRVVGLVELGIGLDDWVGDRAHALAENDAGDPDGLERDDGLGAVEPSVVERPPVRRSHGNDAGAGPPPAGAGPASAPRPRWRAEPQASEARLAQLARAAVAAALRAAGGDAELRRLDGMAARSRAAASLPELRLGAGTSRDESLRLAPTAADPARFTRDGGHDRWVEARLIWRLDSAIFARDEIAIMRLRAQRREELARLTADVLEALVSWQRARLVLASETALPDERDAAVVRQFGAVARLDAFTAGWFSEQLERERGRE
jgi:hypothetical protein